jgi:hypothetical protein
MARSPEARIRPKNREAEASGRLATGETVTLPSVLEISRSFCPDDRNLTGRWAEYLGKFRELNKKGRAIPLANLRLIYVTGEEMTDMLVQRYDGLQERGNRRLNDVCRRTTRKLNQAFERSEQEAIWEDNARFSRSSMSLNDIYQGQTVPETDEEHEDDRPLTFANTSKELLWSATTMAVGDRVGVHNRDEVSLEIGGGIFHEERRGILSALHAEGFPIGSIDTKRPPYIEIMHAFTDSSGQVSLPDRFPAFNHPSDILLSAPRVQAPVIPVEYQ